LSYPVTFDLIDAFTLLHLLGQDLFVIGSKKGYPADFVEIHTDGVIYRLLFFRGFQWHI